MPKCTETVCPKRPNYGKPGGKATCCVLHKSPEMVNVKSKTCTHCPKQPTYGKPGHQATTCAEHKQPGMMFRPTKKCVGCKEPAYYGRDGKLYHCEKHKHDGEVNMVEARCVSCQLSNLLNSNSLCEFCDPESFKNGRLKKQNALMAYMDAHGFNGITDRIVEGGECGKERPDRVLDMGDKIVVIECDEDQHKGNPCHCEQTRMVNIGQSFGGLPVYFIRFNPDGYMGGDAPLLERYKMLECLLRSMQEGRAELPKALTSVTYLFFDGWQGYVEAWDVLI